MNLGYLGSMWPNLHPLATPTSVENQPITATTGSTGALEPDSQPITATTGSTGALEPDSLPTTLSCPDGYETSLDGGRCVAVHASHAPYGIACVPEGAQPDPEFPSCPAQTGIPIWGWILGAIGVGYVAAKAMGTASAGEEVPE